jgi:cytochrome b
MTDIKKITIIRVWDLPLRLFHWSLLVCVLVAFVSVKIGGDAMRWHFYAGYCILVLLLFRMVWGFIGGRYARFSSFPPKPAAAWRSLRGAEHHQLGHNPAGAMSVYALLLVLLFQAVSGLFSNDDVAAEGPWVIKVSKALSDQITGLHKLNEKIIIGLVLLHLLAIAYYHYVKKSRLVKTMVTGDTEIQAANNIINTVNTINTNNINVETPLNTDTVALASTDDAASRTKASIVFACCAILVWGAVNKY